MTYEINYTSFRPLPNSDEEISDEMAQEGLELIGRIKSQFENLHLSNGLCAQKISPSTQSRRKPFQKKDYGDLTIKIDPNHGHKICSRDGAASATARSCTIASSQGWTQECSTFAKHNVSQKEATCNKVSICIMGNRICHPVKLPKEMSAQLTKTLPQYLSGSLPKKRDCAYFVLALKDRREKWDENHNHVKNGERLIHGISELRPGDTIGIIDESETVVRFSSGSAVSTTSTSYSHVAIYLDAGICLSIYNRGGPLCASTIDEMSAFYQRKNIARISVTD